MQIKISPINYIKKTCLRTKQILLPTSYRLNTPSNTNFLFNKNLLPISSALTLLTNWFSKEDLIEVAKLEECYKQQNITDLQILKEKTAKDYLETFKKIGLETKKRENETFYVFDTTLVDKKKRDELKKHFLNIFALNNCLQPNFRKTTKVPLSHWFDTTLGMQKNLTKPSIYIHPEDKAIMAFGGFLKEDVKTIETYCRNFQKYDNQKLFNEKFKILKQLTELQQGNKIYFEGSFSEKELNKIKLLTGKYRALNNIQKSRGIFTKDIETILFAPDIPTEIKKGDYLGGLGYVVNRIQMDNEDFIITFSEINKTNTFNMYKVSELNKKEEFLKLLPQKPSIEKLNELNKVATEILSNNSELISQIGFRVLNGKNAKNIKIDDNINDESLNRLLENETNYFTIYDFNNYSKKYGKAGKIIGIQLLKFLKDQNCLPIFLTAQPYNGSTHSPVSMYLRAGFKPISHTLEEIQEKMSKNMSRYPYTEKVEFYLENFESNGKIIDSLAKLYGL